MCVGSLCCIQVTLLRAHSAEHLILGVARRSLPYNDIILLGKHDSLFSLKFVTFVSKDHSYHLFPQEMISLSP